MVGLPDGRKSLKIDLAVLIQYWRVTDRHPASQPRCRIAYIPRLLRRAGKNLNLQPQKLLIVRDVVLEASVSARGGLEAVFLAGSASPRPRLCLIVSVSVWKVAPCLGSVVISQLKTASAHGAQVQV